MSDSRVENTVKNTITGLINQLISLAFSFLSRTIFIRCLGVEFLGINGLFSNILQILSMADLGFGTAMVYSMYKPIVNDDKKTLAGLMNFYRKIYNIISIAVLILGLLLVPFLPYIVNTESNIEHLTLYYILYVLNTVMSYLFVYKTSITIAHQKSYVLNNYESVFTVVQNVLQIAILILFRNFAVYLIIQILCSFVRNLYKAKKSEKMYPYIKDKVEISNEEKTTIFNNVKSMFIYKIGGVLLNNTDNIIISMLIGTATVGLYSNYLIIITAITSFTNIVFNSMTASIGNLNATSDNKQRYNYFNKINFLSAWVFTFCGISLYILANDFISLWLGSEFIFDKFTIFTIVLNLIIPGMIRTVSLYRDTIGMFRDTKYVFFVTSILNIILSFILGKLLGLSGVLLATTISRLLTNVWFEPYMLFKNYLNKRPILYFKKQIFYYVIFILNLLITSYLSSFVNFESMLINFLLKGILCLFIPNIIMILIYKNTQEFNYFTDMLKNKLLKNRLS